MRLHSQPSDRPSATTTARRWRWPPLRTLAQLALIAVGLSVAACSSSSDERAIREQLARFKTALEQRDERGVCETMTPEAHGAILALTGHGCQELFRLAGDELRAELVGGVDLAALEIDIRGSVATVVIAGREDDPSRLVKRDGRWLIDFMPDPR